MAKISAKIQKTTERKLFPFKGADGADEIAIARPFFSFKFFSTIGLFD
jgi:hypothetical protein